MAAKILYQIPVSNFELIRTQIAAILVTELTHQASLAGNNDLNPDVYTERFTPVQFEELKVLTVNLDRIPLDNDTNVSQKASTIYNIDVYCFGESNISESGYYNSSIKLERIIGLVRHILESPLYIKLDLSSVPINRTSVFNIEMDDGGRNEDGNFGRMARIQFRVEHNETQLANAPLTLDGADTTIKIEETEKGYLITTNI